MKTMHGIRCKFVLNLGDTILALIEGTKEKNLEAAGCKYHAFMSTRYPVTETGSMRQRRAAHEVVS